jgi:hypothetical protein
MINELDDDQRTMVERAGRRLHALSVGPARVKRGRRLMFAKQDVAAWIAGRAAVRRGK